MLNCKNIKIAFSDVEAEIIDDVLYIVGEDGSTLDLTTFLRVDEDAVHKLGLYDNASDGLLTFGIGDRYGYIDLTTGRVACAPQWGWVSLFRDGYALVADGCKPADEDSIAFELMPKAGKVGVIDREFNTVISPVYDEITWTSPCRIAKRGSRYCNCKSIDVLGRDSVALNADNTQVPWFIVGEDDRYGIVDRDGRTVIPPDKGRLTVLSRQCILRADDTLYAGGAAVALTGAYLCGTYDDEDICLIVKRRGKYAVVRCDGTFVSGFELDFAKAKELTAMLLGAEPVIGKRA